jgi:hypothetical protein
LHFHAIDVITPADSRKGNGRKEATGMRGRSLLLLVVLASGCFTPDAATRGMMDRLRAVGGPVGPDVVILDVAEIEQPPEDAFIDRDLWSVLDEQVVGLEHKSAMDDNGLRAGVAGGLPPGKLQALLITDRSCPNPHRITTRAGTVKLVPIGPMREEAAFDLKLNADTTPVKLTSAQFAFTVTPQRTDDGRVRLTILPQAQHGGRTLRLQPLDGDSWSLAGSKAVEKYTNLSFDVTLSPQDFLVIGTRYDHPSTLGHSMFVAPSGDKPVQRILVIRARPQGDTPLPDWTIASSAKTQPLAVQAVKTTRGKSD